jgi:hypothetical protein
MRHLVGDDEDEEYEMHEDQEMYEEGPVEDTYEDEESEDEEDAGASPPAFLGYNSGFVGN